MSKRVFISYSRSDAPLASALKKDLEDGGCEVFIDSQLTGGQSWWSTLLHEIRSCDVFVPVLSNHWLHSRPCSLEADYAAALGRHFLPVTAEEVSPRLFGPEIAETQWVPYAAHDKSGVLRMVASIASLPPVSALPDPLPEPPSIPISYMVQLRDKVSAAHDLERQEQELLLTEIRRRCANEDDHDELLIVLRMFRDRDDLNHRVAMDLDQLQSDIEATQQQQAPTHQPESFVAAPPPQAPTMPPPSSSPAPNFAPPSSTPSPNIAPPQRPPDWTSGPTHAPPVQAGGANGKIIGSYVLSAITLAFLPIIFGPIAIWLAHSEKKAGNKSGDTAFIIAIAATVIGMIIGAIVFASV